MAQITQSQFSLNGATWVDANSLFTVTNQPDRLPDFLAVTNSIFNLLNCTIGERSRIFQPEYGALWKQLLQEPIDQITANKMQMGLLQAIARWEPRVGIDLADSFINPDFSLPGYQVRLVFTLGLTSQKQGMSFVVQK